MNDYLPAFIDAFFRRHPAVLLLCVLALAVIACVILIASGSQALVYEGF